VEAWYHHPTAVYEMEAANIRTRAKNEKLLHFVFFVGHSRETKFKIFC